MSITVTDYQLGIFGNRRLVRTAEAIVRQAERIITRQVGPLPAVAITLTHERAMADFATGADAAFAPEASDRVKAKQIRQSRRGARGNVGVTCLNPDGGIAIFISNTSTVSTCDLTETILHELVHAVQLSAPGARELHIRYLRHCYALEPLSRREEADYDRVVDRREAEAHAIEAFATQIKI